MSDRRNATAFKQSKFDVEQLLISLGAIVHAPMVTQQQQQQCCAMYNKEGKQILETLKEKTKTMDSSDLNYFILRGGVTVLVKSLCLCGKLSINNYLALDICQYLIESNHQTARLFCKQIIGHLYDDIECIGIAEALPTIISLYPIRSIFVEDLIIPKLIEIYHKTSILLSNYHNNNNNNINNSGINTSQNNLKSSLKNNLLSIEKPLEEPQGGWGNILVNTSIGSTKPTCLTASSSSNLLLSSSSVRRGLRDSGISHNHSLTNNDTTSNSSSPPGNESPPLNSSTTSSVQKSIFSLPTSPPIQPIVPLLKLSSSVSSLKPSIPKLNLPLRVENNVKMTRSSRRREDISSTRNFGELKVEQSSLKELSDLATKLGETYMTSDLTALMSYKQTIDSNSNTKRNSFAHKKLVISNESEHSKQHLHSSNDLMSLKSTNLYKVRCNILKTLASATSYNLWLLQYVNNPMNLVYSEILLIYKGLIPCDQEYFNLFLSFAYNWADYVEYIHRIRWNDVTNDLTPIRKAAYRKKLDILLWRINNNILNIIETNVVDDLEYQLHMLADYMSHCPTRIMPSQVVDVCIEVLLKIKYYWFKGRVTAERYKDIYIIHYLLCAFDEIIIQNMHPPLNDLLLAIFIEREDTFTFIKHYTQQLLLSESLEREFEKDKASAKLVEFRCRVLQHHSVCVDMLARAMPGGWLDKGGSSISDKTEVDLQHISDLVRKMDYLLIPSNGVILPFLQSGGSFYHNYPVKKQMLEFLSKIFSFKQNPFTKKKLYIDSYISYFYISFIKLYNNYIIDVQTLTLCKLFLNILIAFSVNKNEKISMKFYQLRTMDFLVREVNLEYEVKQNRDQYIEPFFLRNDQPPKPIVNNNQNISNNTNNVPPVNNTTSTEPVKPTFKTMPILKIPPKVPMLSLGGAVKTDPTNNSSSVPNSSTTVTGSLPPLSKPAIPLLSLPHKVATDPSTTGGDNQQSTVKPPLGKLAIPKLTLPLVKTRATDSEVKSLSNSVTAPGLLSAIEQKIDPQDPKFQLVLGDAASSSMASVGEELPEPTAKELQNENQRYKSERNNRKLYHDKDLQVTILQLIFSLLLNSNQTLEHLYSDQFPIVAKKLNVPFILQLHINHPQNEMIIPELCQKTFDMGPNYFRILKLLFNRLFHSSPFKDLKRVAKGAYGTVYKGHLSNDEGLEVAAKLMAVPKSIHDRCVLHDIFTEILIMDTFRGDHRACHMFDYGVDGENYWIVMKSYKCSLKEWRLKQTGTFLQQLPLYLNIYTNVLLAVQFLVENKINHFDIKCDNFLVHPIKKGTIEEDFWNQPTNDPNFIVCLADWGEAKVYKHDLEGYTTRNRGTEFIKSPEMLTIAYASQKTRENFDRRKKVGSNTASDVWSLGCLFYELLTGDFLFYDDDWVKFFIRVTQPGQELITQEKKSKIHSIPAIIEFMEFVFVRDPFYRPTLRDLLTKFTSMKPAMLAQLEQLKQQMDDSNSSDFMNASSIPTKQYYNGGDGTRYKGTMRSSGHYTPGRFFPHTYNLNNPIGISSKNSTLQASRLIDLNSQKDVVEPPEFPEHKYLMEFPSKITSYMYISSFKPSMNKNMLKNNYHITHIINCTGSPNAFPDHFEYLHLQLHDDSSQDILHPLTSAFDFIRDAIMHQGRVLIVSDKGISRASALAIGYFMDSRSISYFEAFILIRDRRYIVNPNSGFVEQLCRWGRQRRTQKGLAEWGGGIENVLLNNSTTQFQCLCGACVFTLLAPFDSTKYVNPRNCNCEKGENDCPNFLGCSPFLGEMKKLHNYNASAKHVIWGYTSITNVVGDYKRSSVEVLPLKPQAKREWVLYRCKTCHFLTYAIRYGNIQPNQFSASQQINNSGNFNNMSTGTLNSSSISNVSSNSGGSAGLNSSIQSSISFSGTLNNGEKLIAIVLNKKT